MRQYSLRSDFDVIEAAFHQLPWDGSVDIKDHEIPSKSSPSSSKANYNNSNDDNNNSSSKTNNQDTSLNVPELFTIFTNNQNQNTHPITTIKMKTFTAVTTTAIALACLFQPCPAPPVLAAIGMTAGEAAGVGAGLGGGAIAGGIGAGTKGHGKRQDNSLPPVAAAACKEQLHGVTVQVSRVGDNNVRFDNVPPACMTLANVFLGQNRPGQAQPIPMGSASLQYNGLTEAELNTLQNALDVVRHG